MLIKLPTEVLIVETPVIFITDRVISPQGIEFAGAVESITEIAYFALGASDSDDGVPVIAPVVEKVKPDGSAGFDEKVKVKDPEVPLTTGAAFEVIGVPTKPITVTGEPYAQLEAEASALIGVRNEAIRPSMSEIPST